MRLPFFSVSSLAAFGRLFLFCRYCYRYFCLNIERQQAVCLAQRLLHRLRRICLSENKTEIARPFGRG